MTVRIARWVVAGSVTINLVAVACTTETVDTPELDVRDVAAQLASIEADGEAWTAAVIRALDSADAAARIAQEAADDAEAAARAAAATDDAIAHREAAAAQIAAQDAATAAAVAAAAADEVRGSAVDSTAYAAMRVAQRDAVRNMTDRDRANDVRAAEAYAAAAAPYSAEAAADYAEAAAVAREGARRAYGALYSAVAAGRAGSEAAVRAEVARAAAPATTTIPTTTTTTDCAKSSESLAEEETHPNARATGPSLYGYATPRTRKAFLGPPLLIGGFPDSVSDRKCQRGHHATGNRPLVLMVVGVRFPPLG